MMAQSTQKTETHQNMDTQNNNFTLLQKVSFHLQTCDVTLVWPNLTAHSTLNIIAATCEQPSPNLQNV